MTDNTLTLPQQKAMVVHSFRLKENGVEAIGDPSFDQWVSCLQFVKAAGKSVHFWLGDLLNFGELKWGETYRQAVEVTGFDVGTLRNDKWVASRIPPERRQEALSFEHHYQVADMDEEAQLELLTTAAQQKLTRDQFRKFINKQQMRYGKKPKATEQQPTTIAKALATGRIFVQELQKLSVLSYNDSMDLSELLDEIAETTERITYETADTKS